MLFTWAVEALQGAGCDPVILVVPSDLADLAEEEETGALIAAGGPTRQDSVWNGLQLVDTGIVVVHDAARPLVDAALVRNVIGGLSEGVDACLAAVPVDETLKRSQDGSRVLETVDREQLWRSQTPAAFRTDSLRRAHIAAHEDGFTGTDESQLIERIGGGVRVVPGSRANLKVTFPEDFAIAEAMLDARPR